MHFITVDNGKVYAVVRVYLFLCLSNTTTSLDV